MTVAPGFVRRAHTHHGPFTAVVGDVWRCSCRRTYVCVGHRNGAPRWRRRFAPWGRVFS